MGDTTALLGPDDPLMRDILGWDVRTWSVAVQFWQRALVGERRTLKVLELGAGPGGPSLWLALQGHEVLCTNWQSTIEQASPLHERYGVSDRIEYRDVDATRIPFENEFDLVIFKSVIGGVGSKTAQDDAWRGIHRALKPGGRVLFAENLRGTVIHRLMRSIAYRVRKSSWRYPTVRELEANLGAFASHEFHSTGVLAVFGVTEGQRHALAAADERVFNRVTPRSWHYVSYGVATKQ